MCKCVRGTLTLTAERCLAPLLSAAHVGLTERGRIEEGAIADLVLFDPETVQDRATAEEPNVPSNGIEKVWVNGQLVYQDGQGAWYKYGRVLRRQSMSGD